MDSNEQYVRERWEDAALWDRGEDVPAHLRWEAELVHTPGCFSYFHGSTREETWSAAADFTRAHEKKISDVEEEIALLEAVVGTTTAFIASIYVAKHIKQDAAKESPVWQRILAARQAALDELRKGWLG